MNDLTMAGAAAPSPLWPAAARRGRLGAVAAALAALAMAAGLWAPAAALAAATDISGAGATFPYPVYATWADAYNKETGVRVNYQSIGSGGGIKQITAGTVAFGATDAPLSGEDLQRKGLIQFPTAMGGIVPVVNLEGVEPGELVLDGPTLAKIFLGEITRWSDPAIAKLNPGLKLPDVAIPVIHRADGSGTTYNFASYLSQVSPLWDTQVGAATSLQWPVGLGAKGNEGVAANVMQLANAIGYVEYAYAKQNDLAYARMVNRAGNVVAPSPETFAAAAENADWSSAPGFGIVLANEPGETSWPMAAATFILMPTDPEEPRAAAAALRFFDWAFANGDRMALKLGFVPIPDKVVGQVEQAWRQVKGADGQPVYASR